MDLKDLISRPEIKAPALTIFSEGGVGKTFLASTFPSPVFIRAEDGFDVFTGKKPYAMPVLKNANDIFEQLDALIDQDHSFKTLVIDSITALNKIFEDHVVSVDPKAKSIVTANGGYGAGQSAVSLLHSKVKDRCDRLRSEKGMAVVYLGHVEIEDMKVPDQPDYSRYSMRIHKKSIGIYTDFASLVGFMKERSIVNAETGKAKSFGDRVLVCHKVVSSISKNRFDITEEIEVPKGSNPLLDIIPFFVDQKSAVAQ